MIDRLDIRILAEGEGVSIGRIVFFVLVAAGWLISVWLKRSGEQKAQAEAEQKARRRRERQEAMESAAEQDDDWEVVPPPLPREQPQSVSMHQFMHPQPEPVPVPPPKPVKAFVAPKKPRQERMHVSKVAEGKSVEAVAAKAKKIRVALGQPKTARAAMIFHEIFSPPKAFRNKPECWM